MPDKHQPKNKHDAKEQRKPRHTRQQAPPNDKKARPEETRVTVQAKPLYEEPGPEFYQGLKRETDEILKITEEANSKYKKKEIQSNWTKYEIPIDSYEEVEEQENLGADYEKLIQAPMSIGGHFQFKHERSWGINTGPSLYDKYFDINMDNLSNALNTIPFYKRNDIDQTIFDQGDILAMDNRATRYKQKYYNDKSFTTAEMDAQDKILNKLTEKSLNFSVKFPEQQEIQDVTNINIKEKSNSESKDTVLPVSLIYKGDIGPSFENKCNITIPSESSLNTKLKHSEVFVDYEASIESKKIEGELKKMREEEKNKVDMKENSAKYNEEQDIDEMLLKVEDITRPVKVEEAAAAKSPSVARELEETKKPVIESPEDLERWLEDFLDG